MSVCPSLLFVCLSERASKCSAFSPVESVRFWGGFALSFVFNYEVRGDEGCLEAGGLVAIPGAISGKRVGYGEGN
jgi:hypothetical protein